MKLGLYRYIDRSATRCGEWRQVLAWLTCLPTR